MSDVDENCPSFVAIVNIYKTIDRARLWNAWPCSEKVNMRYLLMKSFLGYQGT